MKEDKNIELIEVRCVVCKIKVGPRDRGIFLHDTAVCEKCAHEIWRKLEQNR